MNSIIDSSIFISELKYIEVDGNYRMSLQATVSDIDQNEYVFFFC